MVYLVGIIGFISGFCAGLMLLTHMLRGYSNKDLLKDENLKWKYGILNWLLALLGAVSFVWAYNRYFF